jgi:hypothetical protein
VHSLSLKALSLAFTDKKFIEEKTIGKKYQNVPQI